MSTPDAATTSPSQPLKQAVLGSLSPAELQAYGKAKWVERWLSLWAPVTVLGLVFLVYLVIVESAVCSYHWLQTPMRLVALAAFVTWVALIAARALVPGFRGLRKGRHLAEEGLDEVFGLSKRLQGGKGQAQVVSLSADVARAYGTTDPKAMEKAVEALEKGLEHVLGAGARGGALDFAGGFVKALAVALLIRTVLVEPFKIPSGSMIPTLEVGDQIFVNKFIYGVRLPFTNFVPFQIVRAPKRGDVIVFNNPVHPDVDYIKRVIGVAGDTLEIDGHHVKVNGTELSSVIEADPYDFWDQPNMTSWVPQRERLERETIDGQVHRRMLKFRANTIDENPIVVPPGHVFVMGDNRDNSQDSRYGLSPNGGPITFVPVGNIKGKAMVIWLSLSHGGLFSGLFDGTGFSTERLFLPVGMCGDEPNRPTGQEPR